MKESSKNRLFGICGTVIFHVTLILILFLVTFSQPSIPDDGEGILVQVGLVSESQGTLDSSSDIQSQEKNSPEETIDDNEIISQETEETIQITPPEEKKKDSEKKEIKKEEQKPVQPKEDNRIKNQVANAFSKGKGSSNNNHGSSSSGSGIQGSVNGNSSSGATSGSPGYGNYDLGGRGILGSLPRPGYDNSNDEGTIVVSITVNAAGKVIAASITKGSIGSAASNSTLLQQAINAAKKAVFTKSNNTGNQSGTITYYFKQR